MQNILAAVDFSDVTGAVIDHAVARARAFDSDLWLLHVAAPDPDFVGYEAGPQEVRDIVAGELRDEHRSLQETAQRLRGDGVRATPLLVQGPTIETILHEAEHRRADLIVMGSHGHGALYHLVVGSVSEGVLHKAACPVLIVPKTGEQM